MKMQRACLCACVYATLAATPAVNQALPPASAARLREHTALALRALADVDGWRDADASAVQLADVTSSGNGGLRTFKLTPPPPAAPVALRVGDLQQHGPFMQRLVAVAELMAAHGLAPRLLAHGETWMITEWAGRGFVPHEELDPETAFRAAGERVCQQNVLVRSCRRADTFRTRSQGGCWRGCTA